MTFIGDLPLQQFCYKCGELTRDDGHSFHCPTHGIVGGMVASMTEAAE